MNVCEVGKTARQHFCCAVELHRARPLQRKTKGDKILNIFRWLLFFSPLMHIEVIHLLSLPWVRLVFSDTFSIFLIRYH